MDIVINDLAGKYGVVTEAALGAAVQAAAPTSTTIPTGAATSAAVNAAIWKAAAEVYAATAGQGRVALFMPPDQLGRVRAAVRPGEPAERGQHRLRGRELRRRRRRVDLRHPRLRDGRPRRRLVRRCCPARRSRCTRTGSVRCRSSSLRVLGVQVAYAGYYTWLVVETNGLAEIIKTP